MWVDAMELNKRNVLFFVPYNPNASILDLGCNDGTRTLDLGKRSSSSWCNVFALIMGWQIFSLTNFSSRRAGIGNPLAIYRGEVGKIQSWTHKTILNYSGLVDYFRVFGFKRVKVAGSGYIPLAAVLGRIDARNSHFITICTQKSSGIENE